MLHRGAAAGAVRHRSVLICRHLSSVTSFVLDSTLDAGRRSHGGMAAVLMTTLYGKTFRHGLAVSSGALRRDTLLSAAGAEEQES